MTKTKKIIMLMVEDDEVLLRALYLVFRDDDYVITTATNGDTGLKIAQRIKPDIILLDLLLPKMSGFDFLKYIKAMPDLKNIPIVVLSNLGDQENIEKAKTSGAMDFFIKSNTDLMELKTKIDNIVKK